MPDGLVLTWTVIGVTLTIFALEVVATPHIPQHHSHPLYHQLCARNLLRIHCIECEKTFARKRGNGHDVDVFPLTIHFRQGLENTKTNALNQNTESSGYTLVGGSRYIGQSQATHYALFCFRCLLEELFIFLPFNEPLLEPANQFRCISVNVHSVELQLKIHFLESVVLEELGDAAILFIIGFCGDDIDLCSIKIDCAHRLKLCALYIQTQIINVLDVESIEFNLECAAGQIDLGVPVLSYLRTETHSERWSENTQTTYKRNSALSLHHQPCCIPPIQTFPTVHECEKSSP